jgi:hypothetical protein
MTEQHMNSDTVALWIIRKIFGEFIIQAKFSLFRKVKDTGSSELFGDRSYAVFCFCGIGYISLPVCQSECFLVDGFAFLNHHHRTIEFFYGSFGIHVVVQLLLVIFCADNASGKASRKEISFFMIIRYEVKE